MKNIIYLFALILISCEPSIKEIAKKKMMDSLYIEKARLEAEEDSLRKLFDLMNRGLTEKEAIRVIHETDSCMKQIQADIQKKLK